MDRRQMLQVICATLLSGTAAQLPFEAFAQAYPSKIAKIVTGTSPGTASDATARIIAEALSERFKQQVIVESKPGSGGVIAANSIASAPKDGYTIMLSGGGLFVVTPHLNKALAWNPLTSFEPIAEIGMTPLLLAVSSKSPYGSLADLVAAARAKPGAVTIGIVALTMADIAASLLETSERVTFNKIPYRGTAEMSVALLSGQIDALLVSVGGLMARVSEGGDMRALGLTGTARLSALPDVPSISETIPGYDAGSWFGVFGPVGMDPRAVQALNEAINEVMRVTKWRTLLEDQGIILTGGEPDIMRQRLNSDYNRFGEVINRIGAVSN